jgi:hypothetical protein
LPGSLALKDRFHAIGERYCQCLVIFCLHKERILAQILRIRHAEIIGQQDKDRAE